MSEPLVYELRGHTVVPADWKTWRLQPLEERRVARDQVGEVWVSTIFLGLDHSGVCRRSRGEPPLLFETMVFGGEHDQEQWRYATWIEAEAGHAAVLARVQHSHEESGESTR